MKWDPQKQEWVDEYVPYEKPKSYRLKYTLALLGILLLPALAVYGPMVVLSVAGEEVATRPMQANAPAAAPSPAAPSAERIRDFEKGLSGALVHIIATVQDPAQGEERARTVLASFVGITGCQVAGVDVNTARSKARLDDLAVERVRYAEPDWHDQYVGVTVSVSCD